MEIEIIQSIEPDNLQTTKNFAIILNRFVSNIKMCHWYANNYDLHIITGDLYNDLVELFDKLQEEIIGTCKEGNVSFPEFDINIVQDENGSYN